MRPLLFLFLIMLLLAGCKKDESQPSGTTEADTPSDTTIPTSPMLVPAPNTDFDLYTHINYQQNTNINPRPITLPQVSGLLGFAS